MGLLDGKQIRNTSLALAKINNNAGQGTVTFGTGTMLAITDLPTTDTDLANKGYVDSLSAGLDPKESARLATTADLSATYTSVGGVGGTGEYTGAPTTIDSISIVAGDRIVVKNQADAKQNGIYVVTATTTIWDRAEDHDGSPTNEVSVGNYVFVTEGTDNTAKGYVLTNDQGQTGDLTLNTHNLIWSQFSASSQLSPGAGITTTSQKIAIDLDDNTLEFDVAGDAGQLRVNIGTPGADEIGLDGSAGLVIKKSDITGLIVASNGLTEVTDGNGDKTVKLGGVLTANTTLDGVTGTYSLVMNELSSTTLAVTNGGSLVMNGTTNTFTDADSTGIVYATDYSTNFTNRSLIDKEYVDIAVSNAAGATTAGNGLSMDGTKVELGGALVQATSITGANIFDITTTATQTYSTSQAMTVESTGDEMLINANQGVYIQTTNGETRIKNSTKTLSLSNTAVFTDSSSAGLVYAADYSPNYTNRTLVDKEFVIDSISAIGGEESTTAGNGLTMNGFAVELGGALTKNSTISGATGTYNLTINDINTLTMATNSGYSMVMNGAATFTDDNGSKGMVYNADYSGNYTDRSLVDKAYVDTNSTVATILDKNQTASVTSSDGDTTGTSIANTPLNDAYVEVLVNGQQQYLANGAGEKATSDCYFSSDGGTTAKNIADILIGDTLYWNGTVAGFELAATDSIDYNYSV